MKKFTSITTLLIIAMLTTTQNLQAQDATPGTRLQQVREEVRENRQEFRSEVAVAHANRLENRFGFYGRRLENLIEKLEKRLTALSGNGKDTSTATTKLTTAKTALEDANTLGADAIEAFRAIGPGEYQTQKAAALAARDQAEASRTKFKEALSLIKEVIKLVKELK